MLTLSVRGRRTLARVDMGALALAAVLVICDYWLSHAGTARGY